MTGEDKTCIEIFLAIGLMSFALGFGIRWKERAARTWPQVNGVIVTSTTEQKYVGQRMRAVLPVIEYQFEYQGRLIKSANWRLGNLTVDNIDRVREITDRYPVGQAVTVFVNQRRPMKSVLETQPSATCWVPFSFGILFMALTVLVILVAAQK